MKVREILELLKSVPEDSNFIVEGPMEGVFFVAPDTVTVYTIRQREVTGMPETDYQYPNWTVCIPDAVVLSAGKPQHNY